MSLSKATALPKYQTLCNADECMESKITVTEQPLFNKRGSQSKAVIKYRVLLFMYRGVPYITLAWQLRLEGWHWHWNIDFNLKWVMNGKPSMSHMVSVYNEVPLCVYVQSKKLTVFQRTQSLRTSVKTQICAL